MKPYIAAAVASTVTLSIVAGVSSVVAQSQLSSDAQLIQKLIDELDALKGMADQVSTLTRRIDELERREPATVEITEGAVVAFDRSDACPDGWARFQAADGRFIIGVDGDKYRLPYEAGKPVYQLDGEERVTLTVGEMPVHAHNLRYGAGQSLAAGPNQYLLGQGGHHAQSHDAGSGSSHNNMPPYIALYFCKKEGA